MLPLAKPLGKRSAKPLAKLTPHGLPSPTMRTPTQALADQTLGQPVEAYIRAHRARGMSWRTISRQLHRDTHGQVTVTDVTLRTWMHDDEASEGATR